MTSAGFTAKARRTRRYLRDSRAPCIAQASLLYESERGSAQPAASNSYLQLAEAAGLGVYESGDPWQTPYGSGYAKLDYRRIEL